MRVEVERRPVRVPGFRFAGVAAGLKQSGNRDVALIVSERPAVAVAAFTTNRVAAAPVRIGRERLRAGRVQAILVNSGNANAFTGERGERIARETTRHAAVLLGVPQALVVPSSTGRIGVQLPRARVLGGVEDAVRSLDPDGFHAALEAMMTTDAFPKYALERLSLGGRRITVAGMAKGAGMIAPHMATMLAYVLTDARVGRAALGRVLRGALPESFNAIVVDGDMSTNDTVLLLANGVAGNAPPGPGSDGLAAFAAAVTRVMRALARQIVKDGEGATRLVDVVVRGAPSTRAAVRVADAIARSPLCKTAFFGGDPYAGRLVCAAGYSGVRFDPDRLDVFFDRVQVVRCGVEIVARVERAAARVVAKPEFTVTLDLHAGTANARRMTSDLTVDYVRLNSEYRT